MSQNESQKPTEKPTESKIGAAFGATRDTDADRHTVPDVIEAAPQNTIPMTPEEKEASRRAWRESVDWGDWDPDDFDF